MDNCDNDYYIINNVSFGVKMKIKIYDILFWIFFVLGVIFFLWYVFGDSPTIEQALLILIITFLFKIQSNITSNTLEMKILRRSFTRLVEDFKEHIKHK